MLAPCSNRNCETAATIPGRSGHEISRRPTSCWEPTGSALVTERAGSAAATCAPPAARSSSILLVFSHGHVQVGPTEVAVRRGLSEDRLAQVQRAHDRRRAQVERLGDGAGDALDRNRLGAERLDGDVHRPRHADGVGELDLAARGQAGRDDILGHPARRVRRRAVDLGRVLAAEGAAAVAGHTAVGVDDDLAARSGRSRRTGRR